MRWLLLLALLSLPASAEIRKRDRYQGPQFPARSKITASESILLVSKPIVGENLDRVGLILWNASANSVYVTFAASGDAANTVAVIIGAWSTWVMPMPVYRGPLSGVRNSGSGKVIATELIE